MREQHEVRFYSYSRQYPQWLFPGNTSADPSESRIEEQCERVIDSMNPLTWQRVAQLIQQDKPDALLLQWWTPFWLPLSLVVTRAAHQARIPVITLCHQINEPDATINEWHFAKIALRYSDGIVTTTQRECDLVRATFSAKPARAGHHPIYDIFPKTGLTREAARTQLGIAQDEDVLLFFGFVRKYKGLPTLLDALGKMERPPLLVVAGEFWEDEQSYRAQIERLGLQSRVLIHNRYISNEDIEPYFAAADALALPYLSGSQSGVGMMAVHYGLPIIASDIGGLGEVVQDGVNGFVVPKGDVSALAVAIQSLFDGERRTDLQNAMAHTRSRLSWQSLVGIIDDVAHDISKHRA